LSRPGARSSPQTPARSRSNDVGGPLLWAFDGPLERCLGDIEDALRRAIVQVGDVASLAVLIELSLPALRRRIELGETLQPAWAEFLERVTTRYGLQTPPRVRHLRSDGSLATLVIVYRS